MDNEDEESDSDDSLSDLYPSKMLCDENGNEDQTLSAINKFHKFIIQISHHLKKKLVVHMKLCTI